MTRFDLADPDDDEFSELVDADFGRIDLVGKGANGRPFLIAKSDGLMPPAMVHNLIKNAQANVRRETDMTAPPERKYEVEHASGRLAGRYYDLAKADEHAKRIDGVIRVRQPASAAARVAKATSDADGPQRMAVYDAKGNLVGTVDPDEVDELAEPPNSKLTRGEAMQANAQGQGPPATGGPDLAPAPAAAAGQAVAKAFAWAQETADTAAVHLQDVVAKAVTVQEREEAQRQLDGLAMAMLTAVQHQANARYANTPGPMMRRGSAQP